MAPAIQLRSRIAAAAGCCACTLARSSSEAAAAQAAQLLQLAVGPQQLEREERGEDEQRHEGCSSRRHWLRRCAVTAAAALAGFAAYAKAVLLGC